MLYTFGILTSNYELYSLQVDFEELQDLTINYLKDLHFVRNGHKKLGCKELFWKIEYLSSAFLTKYC